MKKSVLIAAVSALVGAAAAVAAYEIISKYKTGKYCFLNFEGDNCDCDCDCCCEDEILEPVEAVEVVKEETAEEE